MAKFKVYYTIELNEVATHIFESNDFEVKLCSHNDEETYVKELAEFQPDAIMCRTEPITAKMMDTCKNLKVIGKQGAGLDNIDMDHAHAKDITVVYAPAGNANAVAEHAVMLMLMCAKRFTYVDRQFRGGNFLVRMGMEHTYELGGKTLGMIGCGRISQLAMQKCKYGFGMNVIGHAATMAGKTTAVFSLEMPKDQLAMRLLCADARVDMQSVRHGSLRDDDWISLSSALGPLAASNIYIDDTSGITPSQLRSRCRRLKMEHGLDMIMVDYLQLMSADGHVENRQNEVSEISRNLKSIAKELNVPLVALAQLSRAGAQRSDKRPILSDLRDSGAIEQDADVIMFLHREEYYDPNTEDKNIAEVIVAKQRNGPLGTVKLAWLGQYTRFASLQQGGAAQ